MQLNITQTEHLKLKILFISQNKSLKCHCICRIRGETSTNDNRLMCSLDFLSLLHSGISVIDVNDC